MSNKPIHTVKHGNAWVNRREGSPEALSSHRTQAAAIDQGRRQARRDETEHFIHGQNGQIRARNSYGNDPYPPRG